MSQFSRRLILGCLAIAPLTANADEPLPASPGHNFAIGQVWGIRGMPHGTATIGRIEPYGSGTVIHASLVADTPESARAFFGPVMHIGHSPIDSLAFARSVDTLQQASGGAPELTFEAGYQQWRAAHGGVWSVDIPLIINTIAFAGMPNGGQ